MCGENESHVSIDDARRRAVLRGVSAISYADLPPTATVVDADRAPRAKTPSPADLLPPAEVVACLRHTPWIVDGFERLTHRDALEPSGVFRFDPGGGVYSRFNTLTGSDGVVAGALDRPRAAYTRGVRIV